MWFLAVNAANEEEEHAVDRRKLRILRKHLRDISDPFDLPEKQFRHLYRLSREATRVLCENLTEWIQPGVRSTAIPVELKVNIYSYLYISLQYSIFSGDSAYPILPYLMTLKLNQEPGTPSAQYTQAHVSARSRIERCIGELKGRWRCLRKERALHYQSEFADRYLFLGKFRLMTLRLLIIGQ
ncbi:hypothetical protein ALC62_15337 [Cyphomyrmex costatus]|uniref:DDE Tnp4 domain-containing protein n=1 Tax=Cyphomyrmex costatus TaxID=456900 RepID=A0A151I7C0_9HYME|nr:hypothetical protein ALC62_15337 [Cyphomyrmex costatus]